MNIFFDIGHPAHVHLFKNFIFYLKGKNHKVILAANDKDITFFLLRYYNIESLFFEGFKKGLVKSFLKLINRDLIYYNLYNKEKIDIAFGTSSAISHLSLLKNKKSFIFNEDDDYIIPIVAYLSYPFATKIIVPDCLKYKKWKKKRVLHNSYHELAYLHPNNFAPNPEILEKLGIKSTEKYFIIRLSALKAHHDVGAKGLTREMQKEIIEFLQNYGKVFITAEYALDDEFKKYQFPISPELMHDAMFYATMVIGDSQTMIAESAVLGTPAIRYNSFVGRISYLEELEHKYGLTYGFKPGQEGEMINKIKELVNDNDLKAKWNERREIMLSEKCDLNQWMIDYFEREINK